MEKTIKLMSIFLMVLAIFALPGCGNDKEDEPTYPTSFNKVSDIIGVWHQVGKANQDGSYSNCFDSKIKFNADGTFEFNPWLSTQLKGTYTFKNGVANGIITESNSSWYEMGARCDFFFKNYEKEENTTSINITLYGVVETNVMFYLYIKD